MSALIISVLKEAHAFFDGFPDEQNREIARWVQDRVNAIRNGDQPPPDVSAGPSLPRTFTQPVFETYDREPGEEG